MVLVSLPQRWDLQEPPWAGLCARAAPGTDTARGCWNSPGRWTPMYRTHPAGTERRGAGTARGAAQI